MAANRTALGNNSQPICTQSHHEFVYTAQWTCVAAIFFVFLMGVINKRLTQQPSQHLGTAITELL